MDDKRNLPEVLHVGFSKCASTFLQAFFESHPQIYLVNQSHYFSPFQMDFYHKGKGWYSTLYQQAGKDQKKLESDEHIIMPLLHPILQSAATTIDSVKEVTERMIETNPSVKVILIVRNQLSLMVSRYSEFLLCGGKNDFETFVEEQLSCSKDGRNYYENFYFQILKILESRLGKENVLFLMQENLSANEDEVIGKLCDFIDVPKSRPQKRDIASRRVGLSLFGMKIVRKFNFLFVIECKKNYQNPRVRMPFILYKILMRLYRHIDFYLPEVVKGDKSCLLTPELKERILGVFREDNRLLGEYLNIDVEKLGYIATQ